MYRFVKKSYANEIINRIDLILETHIQITMWAEKRAAAQFSIVQLYFCIKFRLWSLCLVLIVYRALYINRLLSSFITKFSSHRLLSSCFHLYL